MLLTITMNATKIDYEKHVKKNCKTLGFCGEVECYESNKDGICKLYKTKKKMKWVIVGFDHPYTRKSLVYKQNILENTLIKTLMHGIEQGCNIFSIRGFEVE